LIRILLYIVDSKKEFSDIERWVVGRFLFFNPLQPKIVDQQFIEVLLSIISRIQNKDLKYHFIKFLIYLGFPQPLIFDKIFEIIDRQNLKLRNSIAHGEFKILDDEIRFCNTAYGKVQFKARISKDRIEGLMKELKSKVI